MQKWYENIHVQWIGTFLLILIVGGILILLFGGCGSSLQERETRAHELTARSMQRIADAWEAYLENHDTWKIRERLPIWQDDTMRFQGRPMPIDPNIYPPKGR